MCTLSLFSNGGRVIATINRDERRDRLECPELVGGYAPETGIHYCYPVDALHGGTWFGFNSAGMAAALINRYQDMPSRRNDMLLSRGQIIPRLLPKENPAQVEAELRDLDWQSFAPCDLLLIWRDRLARWSWDGEHLASTVLPMPRAYFLTSTSRDPQTVIAYRKQIFYWFVASHRLPVQADTVLRDLHLRPCEAIPSRGIFMSRQERHTKSVCQLILGQGEMRFHYLGEHSMSNFKTPSIAAQPTKLLMEQSKLNENNTPRL